VKRQSESKPRLCSFAVPHSGEPWGINGEFNERSIASNLPVSYQKMFDKEEELMI